MFDKLTPESNFTISVSKKLILPQDNLYPDGIWILEHHRRKKNGDFKLLDRFDFHNGVTNAGRNYLLNTSFAGGTPITAWYASIIDNTGFTALSSTDTMGSHGWNEFIGYDQANRVAWTPANSTAQLLTNASLMVFDINSNGTLYGAFLTSSNTKGGTTGTLWTTGAYSSPVPVSAGTDQIRLVYNLTI